MTPDQGGFPQVRTWGRDREQTLDGGTAYGQMIHALREFLDDVAAARPRQEELAALTGDLHEWSARLAESAVGEREQIFARRLDLPGRGQVMSPAFAIVEGDDQRVRGTVELGRYFLGGGGAAHGGVLPLLFDEVMGVLANSGDRAPSRTAYLRVDYRAITPIEVTLDVEAWFVREEGRKRFVRAEVRHGDTICAEADALFVILAPDQP